MPPVEGRQRMQMMYIGLGWAESSQVACTTRHMPLGTNGYRTPAATRLTEGNARMRYQLPYMLFSCALGGG